MLLPYSSEHVYSIQTSKLPGSFLYLIPTHLIFLTVKYHCVIQNQLRYLSCLDSTVRIPAEDPVVLATAQQ